MESTLLDASGEPYRVISKSGCYMYWLDKEQTEVKTVHTNDCSCDEEYEDWVSNDW